MSRRTLSGVERTGSLPEEHFMNSVAGHSAETRPSPFVEEHNHLLRRNSLPSKRNVCYILTLLEFIHPFLPLGGVFDSYFLLSQRNPEIAVDRPQTPPLNRWSQNSRLFTTGLIPTMLDRSAGIQNRRLNLRLRNQPEVRFTYTVMLH